MMWGDWGREHYTSIPYLLLGLGVYGGLLGSSNGRVVEVSLAEVRIMIKPHAFRLDCCG